MLKFFICSCKVFYKINVNRMLGWSVIFQDSVSLVIEYYHFSCAALETWPIMCRGLINHCSISHKNEALL